MINTKLQNIIDTKSAIGNAIVNKGGTINSATPFYEYAPVIENLASGGGTIDGTDYVKFFIEKRSDDYGGNIDSIAINNGYVYAGGNRGATDTIRRYYENNLGFLNNTVTYGSDIKTLAINNGFIYAGGSIFSGVNRGVAQYHEGNLVRVGNTGNYGGTINSIVINNGSFYVGGGTNNSIQKYNESDLNLTANVDYGGGIWSLAINNGFIYAGGDALTGTNRGISKFHESNLVLVENSVNYGGTIRGIAINNGYVYAGGSTNQTIQKFYESNLAFVGNTNAAGTINEIVFKDGYMYVGGTSGIVSVYHESNLAYVDRTVIFTDMIITSLQFNNGYLFVSGLNDNRISASPIPVSFTNSLNGQAYYLIPKE